MKQVLLLSICALLNVNAWDWNYFSMIKNIHYFGKDVKMSPFIVTPCKGWENNDIASFDYEGENSRAYARIVEKGLP